MSEPNTSQRSLGHAMVFRKAENEDLIGLLDLERAANLAALGHVFPLDRYPFPDDDVLARWRLVMDDPDVTVLVVDADPNAGDTLAAYAAYDDSALRHLAVHPDRWGQGLGTAAIELALRGMGLRGSTQASLWCLKDNSRARRRYEHLGWMPTDDVREAPWSPHPLEMRYTRLIVTPEGRA